ncbi:MAG: DUF4331 domain-containing protein [Chitinophagaceae bacterium]|nr:MAG: DUF4331 domain-containing protein [Chitinophagaceae bacterium]
MFSINRNTILCGLLALAVAGTVSCKKKDEAAPADTFDTSGTFVQKDQNGRPGISTVFIGASQKEQFNTTVPSALSAAFRQTIFDKLTAFGYTQNALGQDKNTFAGLLSNDVLNAKLSGPTTFFDGTNVLTGRKPDDDVIDVELLLIFGGPMGTSNPGLTKDNVNSNDKAFAATFPYLATPH